jgi:nucleotide-binding universal stress UspA family protein
MRPDADFDGTADTVAKRNGKGGTEMNASKPILFATDGSPCAEDAQREALDLARKLDAPLVVVTVAHPALPVGYGGYGYANAVSELTEAERHRVEKVLAAVAADAYSQGLECSTVAAEGFIVDAICQKATEHDAQLIVVGSHGWGAARRLFSGSVSTGLVHSAPCPVLVVRRQAHAHEHPVAA